MEQLDGLYPIVSGIGVISLGYFSGSIAPREDDFLLKSEPSDPGTPP